MIANKICFTHIRNLDDYGHVSSKGGMTTAWMINNDGDLEIGFPARCNTGDQFCRAIGRNLAIENFKYGMHIAVIPHHELRVQAVMQAAQTFQLRSLSQNGNNKLLLAFMDVIEDETLTPIMSSNWYEEIVRIVSKNYFTH
jgi:hypothetical protein